MRLCWFLGINDTERWAGILQSVHWSGDIICQSMLVRLVIQYGNGYCRLSTSGDTTIWCTDYRYSVLYTLRLRTSLHPSLPLDFFAGVFLPSHICIPLTLVSPSRV